MKRALSSSREKFFRTDDIKKDLGKRSVRGGTATVAGQATSFLLRFFSTAYLARILTPEDYGLVAMTAVVTGFAGLFSDAGLTWATVQWEDIDHDQVSNLFWINVALGCVITLVLVAISPLVARLFREPRLTEVTCGLALTFLFGGVGVQHRALLRRKMRFNALAAIEVLSISAGIVAAIMMARAGFKYWSLVGMALIQAFLRVLATYVAIPWRPCAPWRMESGTGVGKMVRFGGNILAFNMINYFSRNADNLLIGWYWGAVPLGLYEKAYKLLLFPISQINAPISAVAVPALSRVKSDQEQFKRYFLGALQLIASIVTPVILIIAIFSNEIVALWLGPTWLQCAPLFRALSVAALFGALSNPLGWFLISVGLTRRYRQIGMVTATFIVTAFIIGLGFGPRGVAIAYSAVMCIITIPVWAWALRGTCIGLHEVIKTLGVPLISGLITSLLTVVFVGVAGKMINHIFVASLGIVMFCLFYAIILLLFFGKWEFFRNVIYAGGPFGIQKSAS